MGQTSKRLERRCFMNTDKLILGIIDLSLTLIKHQEELEELIKGLDVDEKDKEQLLQKVRELRKSIKRWDER